MEPQKKTKKNKRDLPENLKSEIENLSGFTIDDIKVHYNSEKTTETELNTHAYAQGTDIHLASGQEKHLPHEAWHKVQKKKGRMQPNSEMKNKVKTKNALDLEKDSLQKKEEKK